MLDILTCYWWAVAMRGVVSLVFGVMALLWPGALMFLFGAYALVDGILALGTAAFDGRLAGGWRGWLLLEGILGSPPVWPPCCGLTSPPWRCCG